MIVRVNFKGIVMRGTKKLVMRDHIDLHLASVSGAEALFKKWLLSPNVYAVRGDSGVFHPLGKLGRVVVTSVEEVTA